jgi:hypothetical protein
MIEKVKKFFEESIRIDISDMYILIVLIKRNLIHNYL